MEEMGSTSSKAASGNDGRDPEGPSGQEQPAEDIAGSRAFAQRPPTDRSIPTGQAPHRSLTMPTACSDSKQTPTQRDQDTGSTAGTKAPPSTLAMPAITSAFTQAPDEDLPLYSMPGTMTHAGPLSFEYHGGRSGQMPPQQDASRRSASGIKRRHSEDQFQSNSASNVLSHGSQGSIHAAKKQKAVPSHPTRREPGSAPPAPARKTSGGKQESEWAKTVRAQRERERAANSHRTIAPKPLKRPEGSRSPAAVETSAIQRGQSSQYPPVASATALLPSQSYHTLKAGRDYSNGADSFVGRSMTGDAGLASGKGSNTGSNSRPAIANMDLQGRPSTSSDRASRVSGDAHKTASGDSSRLSANVDPQNIHLDREEGRSDKVASSTGHVSTQQRHGQAPPGEGIARREKTGTQGSNSADVARSVHPRMFLPAGPSRLRESWILDEDHHDQGAIGSSQHQISVIDQRKPVRKPGVPAEHYRAQYDDTLEAQNSASNPQVNDGNAQEPENEGLVLIWDQAIEALPVVESAVSAWKSEEAMKADVSFTTDYTFASILPYPPIVASINMWHPFMNTRTARQMSRATLARQGAGAEADWRKRAEEMLARLN